LIATPCVRRANQTVFTDFLSTCQCSGACSSCLRSSYATIAQTKLQLKMGKKILTYQNIMTGVQESQKHKTKLSVSQKHFHMVGEKMDRADRCRTCAKETPFGNLHKGLHSFRSNSYILQIVRFFYLSMRRNVIARLDGGDYVYHFNSHGNSSYSC